MKRPPHSRDYRALVTHLHQQGGEPSTYHIGWPAATEEELRDPPVLEAVLGLYGYDPLVRLFILGDNPSPGVPLNEELAYALASTVQIPSSVVEEQLKNIEREVGCTLTKERVVELYDRAYRESKRGTLPIAYFGFSTHPNSPGEVAVSFCVRPYLPIQHLLTAFREVISRYGP